MSRQVSSFITRVMFTELNRSSSARESSKAIQRGEECQISTYTILVNVKCNMRIFRAGKLEQ